MLKTLKKYNDSGEEIPDALYKSLALSSHIHVQEKLDELCEFGCPQSGRNKDEINRLRGRNNITDTLTAVVSSIAIALGLQK